MCSRLLNLIALVTSPKKHVENLREKYQPKFNGYEVELKDVTHPDGVAHTAMVSQIGDRPAGSKFPCVMTTEVLEIRQLVPVTRHRCLTSIDKVLKTKLDNYCTRT